MTRAEIDNLPAGTEADVMCARAMGATRMDVPRQDHVKFRYDADEAWRVVEVGGGARLERFRPSTVIADAMVLVEIMRKTMVLEIGIGDCFGVLATRRALPLFRVRAIGVPTLPLAIVRAFLHFNQEAAE